MDKDDFPLDNNDEMRIVFEEVAKIMAVMFKSLLAQGLSAQEAAALTAAFCHQNMPQGLEGPQDGS